MYAICSQIILLTSICILTYIELKKNKFYHNTVIVKRLKCGIGNFTLWNLEKSGSQMTMYASDA